MAPLEAVGKMLLILGGVALVLGLLLVVLARVPFVGRLPGDFQFKWGNVSCYFPLVTGIVLSILATIVLNLVIWLLRK